VPLAVRSGCLSPWLPIASPTPCLSPPGRRGRWRRSCQNCGGRRWRELETSPRVSSPQRGEGAGRRMRGATARQMRVLPLAPRSGRLRGVQMFPETPSFLCSSQVSSAPKSVSVGEFGSRHTLAMAQARRGWIPVTSTGMRADLFNRTLAATITTPTSAACLPDRD
jgi:hypothetical protein